MKTAAIQRESIGGIVRGELIERHGDGTATIRFAGSLTMRGTEITIADMMAAARQEAEGSDP